MLNSKQLKTISILVEKGYAKPTIKRLLKEDITPTVEFIVPEENVRRKPEQKDLSAIQVVLGGDYKKPLSIQTFLSFASDKSSSRYEEVHSILYAVKSLMIDEGFKGSLLEFIYVFFGEFNPNGHDMLDVAIRAGYETNTGKGNYEKKKAEVKFDSKEIGHGEEKMARFGMGKKPGQPSTMGQPKKGGKPTSYTPPGTFKSATPLRKAPPGVKGYTGWT